MSFGIIASLFLFFTEGVLHRNRRTEMDYAYLCPLVTGITGMRAVSGELPVF